MPIDYQQKIKQICDLGINYEYLTGKVKSLSKQLQNLTFLNNELIRSQEQQKLENRKYTKKLKDQQQYQTYLQYLQNNQLQKAIIIAKNHKNYSLQRIVSELYQYRYLKNQVSDATIFYPSKVISLSQQCKSISQKLKSNQELKKSTLQELKAVILNLFEGKFIQNIKLGTEINQSIKDLILKNHSQKQKLQTYQPFLENLFEHLSQFYDFKGQYKIEILQTLTQRLLKSQLLKSNRDDQKEKQELLNKNIYRICSTDQRSESQNQSLNLKKKIQCIGILVNDEMKNSSQINKFIKQNSQASQQQILEKVYEKLKQNINLKKSNKKLQQQLSKFLKKQQLMTERIINISKYLCQQDDIKSKQKIGNFQTSLLFLQEKIKQLKLRQKNNSQKLEMKNEYLSSQIQDNKENEIEEDYQQNDRLKQQKNNQVLSLQQLKNSLNQYIQKYHSLENIAETKDQIISKLTQQQKELQTKLKQIQKELQESKKRKLELHDQIYVYKEQVNNLNMSLYKNKTQIPIEDSLNLQRRLTATEQAKHSSQTKHSHEDYKSKILKYGLKCKKLTKQLQNKEKQILEWKNRYQEMVIQNTESNETVCRLNDIIKDMTELKSSSISKLAGSKISLYQPENNLQNVQKMFESTNKQVRYEISKQNLMSKSILAEKINTGIGDSVVQQNNLIDEQGIQTSFIFSIPQVPQTESISTSVYLQTPQQMQIKLANQALLEQIQDFKLKDAANAALIETQKNTLLLMRKELQASKNIIKQLQNQKTQFQIEFKKSQGRFHTFFETPASQLALFSCSNILEDQDSRQRQYLLKQLKLHAKNIRKTKLLYRYELLNKINFHSLIDHHPHIVFLCKTIYGHLIAAYSQKPFQPKSIEKGDACLMSLTNKRTFNVKDKKAIIYDEYYLIFGNSQIRIRTSEKKIFSNFAINNCYYDNQGQKVDVLLGMKEIREVDLLGYQIYSLQLEQY